MFSYFVFSLKLALASLPFIGAGALLALLLPPISLKIACWLVVGATLFGFLLMVLGSNDPLDSDRHKRATLAAKAGFLAAVLISSTGFATFSALDSQALDFLTLPMYMLAGKIFFRIRYA